VPITTDTSNTMFQEGLSSGSRVVSCIRTASQSRRKPSTCATVRHSKIRPNSHSSPRNNLSMQNV